jgi:hypothetical protein
MCDQCGDVALYVEYSEPLDGGGVMGGGGGGTGPGGGGTGPGGGAGAVPGAATATTWSCVVA